MAIAIVGSGPAGFYMADALSKKLPEVPVHIFERMALPFGLVRYGVAPDHPGTKVVYRIFDRVMKRPNVRYFGNVDVGGVVSLEQLESTYEVIVVATGGAVGRLSQFPGVESFYNVSGLQFAGWLNGKEGALAMPPPTTVKSLCILGNGNVSLDAARLLARTPSELKVIGVPDEVVCWREQIPLEAIHILGRRSAGETKFGVSELEELGRLDTFSPVVSPQAVADSVGSNTEALDVLRRFSQREPDGKLPITLHFKAELLGGDGRFLKINSPYSGSQEYEANMVVHAIGQRAAPLPGLPFDDEAGCIPNHDGLVDGKEGVYVVGWAAKAGGGQIATNRAHAQQMLPKVLEHFPEGQARQTGTLPDNAPAWLPSTALTWEQAFELDPWRVQAEVSGA